jgi:hypothetical protein
MERWAPVVGFETLYHVSTMGRVKSLGREFVRKNPFGTSAKSLMRYPEKIITRCKGKPYLLVSLSPGRCGRVRRWLHRLVLEAFVGPCPDGFQCRHKNGNPTDNRLANLCWGTPTENQRDRVKHGTNTRGEKSPAHKLTNDIVREIRRLHRHGQYGKGSYVLAKRYGVSQGCIDSVVSRRTWNHVE